MESASQKGALATEIVLRDTLIAMTIIIIIMIMTAPISVAVRRIIMNAMEHAPRRISLVMERVLRDMFRAMVIATLKTILTNTCGTAVQHQKVRDNA